MRKDRSNQVRALIQQALQAATIAHAARSPMASHEAPTAGLSAPQAGPRIDLSAQIPGSPNEAVFNSAIQKLIAASGGKISVSSGKRSSQRQAQLWAEALKKYGSPEKARKWVAPPGHSKHELGLANDLKFADPATRAWAHQHAGEFGLTFPLANESWHIEPIGVRKKR